MATEMLVGATQAQRGFIHKLLSERTVTAEQYERATGPLTKKDASAVITSLLEMGKKVQPKYEQTEPAQAGYYVETLDDGSVTVYVVVVNKKNDHRSAKRLVLPSYPGGRAKWVYAKGAVFKLAGQEPLTIQQASEFGHLHGYCLCCGAALDVPLSVAAGIGPVCVKKHYGMTQLQFLRTKKGGVI